MSNQYWWLIPTLALSFCAPSVTAQTASGTAFAVAPERLVTNEHVVAGCTSVEVIAADGRRTGAVVDSDAQIDLALLRVTGIKGATARLRNPRNARLGESVMVFGFPLTGSLTSGGNFTSGLVSGLRGLRDAAGEIQITAPVQPGNSGGPLMDASGLIIGVVQAKLDALRSAIATGDIPQNVNFAISLDVLADFLSKNNVAFRDSAIASPLSTARVAEIAQSFTYRVECRRKSQQAGASPGTKSKPPMAGPPGNSFKDCDVCPEMVVILAGSFNMGSPFSDPQRYADEQPQHQVTISRPFAAGKYEVTFDEWDTCVRENACSHNPGHEGWGRGKRPVINISWNDAKQYTDWLSRKTGKNYRLLSEAQWEYVARANTTTAFAFGERITPQQANYASGIPVGTSLRQSVVAGSYPANDFGLHDGHGNVSEWTEDCYNANYNGAPTDGSAWTSGDCGQRVLRGGSWSSHPRGVRSAIRTGYIPTNRDNTFGLRVSRTD